MSEIKVDVVSPYTGTSMTVGESGDTVTCSGTAVGFGGGKVLQVVSTNKTSTFSYTSSSSTVWTDITGLSLSITPAATTSKILITFSVNTSWGGGNYRHMLRIYRNTTAIAIGDTSGNRTGTFTHNVQSTDAQMGNFSGNYVDSPSTTSATTYKMSIMKPGSSITAYVNQSFNAASSDYASRGVSISTITAMELESATVTGT